MSYEDNPENQYGVEEISSEMGNSGKKGFNEYRTGGGNMSGLKDLYCNIVGN